MSSAFHKVRVTVTASKGIVVAGQEYSMSFVRLNVKNVSAHYFKGIGREIGQCVISNRGKCLFRWGSKC